MNRQIFDGIKVFAAALVIVGLSLWVTWTSLEPSQHIYEEEEEGEGFAPLGAGWNGISLGGYTSRVSVAQGETINFHISTDKPSYSLKIYREGLTRQLKTTIPGLTGTPYSCAEGYAPPGCNWPVAYTLPIPTSWPSGAYTADIPTNNNGTQKM